MLDTTLTDELIEEGFVREIISKIQTMRKEAGFEVMDRISVTLSVSDMLYGHVTSNLAQICDETLADSVIRDEPAGYVKEWNINGENAVFGVKKTGE